MVLSETYIFWEKKNRIFCFCDHIGRHLGFLSSPSVMPNLCRQFQNLQTLPNILVHNTSCSTGEGGGPKFLVLIVTLPLSFCTFLLKKVNRKIQGVPQAQVTANTMMAGSKTHRTKTCHVNTKTWRSETCTSYTCMSWQPMETPSKS